MAVKTTIVWCRSRFIAFHNWPEASGMHHYLSYPHRHEFHVEVATKVHADRQIEFIKMRADLDQFLRSLTNKYGTEGTTISFSCETFASAIADHMRHQNYSVHKVSVSEDGENGATVYYE